MIRLLLLTSFLMLAVMLGAPLFIWAGMISPLGGFGATMGAWVVGAGAGLLSGLVGIFKPDSRPLAWGALALGLVMAGSLFLTASQVQTVPIHDVTTDLDDPPQFTVAAEHPDNSGRDMSYPHGAPESPRLQRQHYPEIGPAIVCDYTVEKAWQQALAAVDDMNWQVTSANSVEKLIEAEATSGIFHFVDDIVVRLRSPNGDSGCVTIDVRSTSRVGRSDLGANAARIEQFLARCRALILAEPHSLGSVE